MTSHGFDIIVTDKSVDVGRDPKTSFKDRFRGALFLMAISLILIGVFSMLPDKEGPSSTWTALSSKPIDYSKLSSNFCFIFPFLMLMGGFMIWWVRAAWPADDALHCDRNSITISRTRWLDTRDRLVPHTYAIDEISQLRYSVIASARGGTIYALRFRLNGKKQSLLAGLEAPEAKMILNGLRALGVDVPDDPKLEKRIKQVSEMRGGDTSWMDRSWMNDDSKTSGDKS